MPAKKPQEIPADIRRMSFEKALEELEAIVRHLEGGEVGLEDSIATYDRGNLLKRHCEDKLAAAREKIEQIELAPDGGVSAAPLKTD
ncbi:MAG: exodeoxyribonuclease VII small subunit [Proteobacteria bacterium]|nr:exodeoxyribonuclease VII small subunit [Pseudomonadota bacterium]MDA1131818.1 exodeoxyribonuclease VII small subunit [Pseudomonadota bacterium]